MFSTLGRVAPRQPFQHTALSRVRNSRISLTCHFHQHSLQPRGRFAITARTQLREQQQQQQQQQQKQHKQHHVRFQATIAAQEDELKPPVTSPLVYSPPTRGLISKLPASWIPYAELIRLDKPAGTYYLYLPCLFGTLLAAPMATPVSTPLELVSTASLFFAGALIMRGAGCTINDLWDRNLDPHVERTRLRPIARRAIDPPKAIVYLGFQLLAGLAVLLQFPTSCLFYGIPSLVFVTAYPLAKRVTNYPQFVLGLTFSWGAMLAFPAMGVDLLSNSAALAAAAALYASSVTWTLNYDMIYAFMDIKDDPNAGIKSMAQVHTNDAKRVLYVLSATQIGLLGLAGYCAGAGPLFYLVSCGGGAVALTTIARKVKLDDPKDCWWWFRNGAWLTGGTISLGMFVDYLYRRSQGQGVASTAIEQIADDSGIDAASSSALIKQQQA